RGHTRWVSDWSSDVCSSDLEQALRTDAAIELVGSPTWFSGRLTCLRFLSQVIGAPGNWRMIPTLANGQPAAAAYRRNGDGGHHEIGRASRRESEEHPEGGQS